MVIGVVLMTVFNQFNTRQTPTSTMEYSQFLEEAKAGRISRATIDGRVLKATTQEGRTITVYTPGVQDIWMVSDLMRYGVQINASKPEEEQSFLASVFVSWFPMLLLIGVWIFFMRQMQGGGKGGAFSFGKSKARMLDESANSVTFADVAGCDEAKEEVAELVEFLRDPSKFQKLGGRIPKGVLMVGSPGTGKTLLAKAIAGEAKVPFFSISGSDFVEMFVGVGAARVRDMFEQAKKQAPCIIFIDEIDAVGRHRGAGLGGGNDEREQTLNQLLVEMDGFETGQGIIVIAATNRPDVLDPALLRPGRFDRRVVMDQPDIKGREEIMKVHVRGKPLAEDVDLETLARATPGFVGADLENMVNEAAILAARRNRRNITMTDLTEAIERVAIGPERKGRVISEQQKRVIAYHEAGHALVQEKLSHTTPVLKVTIVGRGMAGGYMWPLDKDSMLRSRTEMEQEISVALAGRVAEEIVFGQVTTGASNDLEQVTKIARRMVTTLGMSERMGPLTYGQKEEMIFLGREIAEQRNYSEEVAEAIDREVQRIVNEAHQRTRQIITTYRDLLNKIAEQLMEVETLDQGAFKRLVTA